MVVLRQVIGGWVVVVVSVVVVVDTVVVVEEVVLVKADPEKEHVI